MIQVSQEKKTEVKKEFYTIHNAPLNIPLVVSYTETTSYVSKDSVVIVVGNQCGKRYVLLPTYTGDYILHDPGYDISFVLPETKTEIIFSGEGIND